MKYNELVKKVTEDYGFESVESLLRGDCGVNLIQDFIYDLVIEAQRECLKNAYENSELEWVKYTENDYVVSEKSIKNENNIIK